MGCKLAFAAQICPQRQYSLGPKTHAKAGQVSIGGGEENHEEDVPSIMGKEDRQVPAGSHITQHEEWDEDHTKNHHQG